jgi:hypothetical protein
MAVLRHLAATLRRPLLQLGAVMWRPNPLAGLKWLGTALIFLIPFRFG